jgi:hypothetical protein
MTNTNGKLSIRWLRAVLGGVMAEAVLFAIVFPVLHFWGQTAFLASILIGSAACPFVFALWVCRGATSQFLWNGALVGITAAIVYLIIAWGHPEPVLYKIAHGLKVLGGLAGGGVASLRKPASARAEQKA